MKLCSIFDEINIQDLKNQMAQISYSILPCPNAQTIPLPMTKFKTKETMFITPLNTHYSKYHWIDVVSFQLIRNDNIIINCLHIKNKSATDPSALMMYAQDERSNLGTSLSFLIDLSSYFKMSIITIEYTNVRNSEEVKNNIDSVYCYINKLQTIKRIVLFGFSIGVYAIVSIIQTKNINKVESIILLSPGWSFSPDSFRNNKKGAALFKKNLIISLSSINRPIFLVHGKKDYYVKYLLSYQISNQIAVLTEWYPENGEHWDIHIKHRSKFYKKITKFFSNLKKNSNKNLTTVLASNSNKELFTPCLNLKADHSFKQMDNNYNNNSNDDSNGNIIMIEGKRYSDMDIGNHNVIDNHEIANGGEDEDFYHTFKLGDIIPNCQSFKINAYNNDNDILMHSFKKNCIFNNKNNNNNNNYHNNDHDHNQANCEQEGFSFTPKICQSNGNINISN